MSAGRRRRPYQHNKMNASGNESENDRCYLCGSEEHYARDCEFKEEILELTEKIRILTKRAICEPCQVANMKNKTNKQLPPSRTEILELISIDIAGPFQTSLRGNTLMMEIVDNGSRKNWSIPMKSKDEAIPELHKFKLREELQTGKEIKRTCADNAPEVIKLLQE
jgi:hypothetical protein